jgi:AAA+ ATPase superfamily predicted ATPase
VKWSELNLKEARGILTKLEEKSKVVEWCNEERKEHFGIIAKKIKEKEKLRRGGYLCYDLKDFEKE